MDEQAFLRQLAEMMDTEADLAMDTQLGGIEEWDSLSYVAFMAFAHNVFRRDLKREAVRESAIVQDLYRLVTE